MVSISARLKNRDPVVKFSISKYKQRIYTIMANRSARRLPLYRYCRRGTPGTSRLDG